jgi:hypothetical protein
MSRTLRKPKIIMSISILQNRSAGALTCKLSLVAQIQSLCRNDRSFESYVHSPDISINSVSLRQMFAIGKSLTTQILSLSRSTEPTLLYFSCVFSVFTSHPRPIEGKLLATGTINLSTEQRYTCLIRITHLNHFLSLCRV